MYLLLVFEVRINLPPIKELLLECFIYELNIPATRNLHEYDLKQQKILI